MITLGKTIQILDKEYKILTNETARDSVVIIDIEQIIYINSSRGDENHRKKILGERLRRWGQNLIKEEIEKLSKIHGFKYNRITLRNQRSRFGSCSSKGNLNFNWQIIFFPPDYFRHILLHELTHLEIKNHKRVFWQKLAEYDAGWREHHQWLRKEGNKRFLI